MSPYSLSPALVLDLILHIISISTGFMFPFLADTAVSSTAEISRTRREEEGGGGDGGRRGRKKHNRKVPGWFPNRKASILQAQDCCRRFGAPLMISQGSSHRTSKYNQVVDSILSHHVIGHRAAPATERRQILRISEFPPYCYFTTSTS